MPEVTASSRGVSFITLGPACTRSAECDRDAVGPAYRARPSLDVAAYEPLRLDALGAETADLAWGLTCLEKSCFALTAQNTSPARVMIAELEPKSAAWQAPAEKLGVEPAPRVEETSVLATTEPVAVIAYDRRANGGLLGWLTAFDPSTPWARLKTPAKDGRLDPERSALLLAPVSDGHERRDAGRSGRALSPRSLARRALARLREARLEGARARLGRLRRRRAAGFSELDLAGGQEGRPAHADAEEGRSERRLDRVRRRRLCRRLDRRAQRGSRGVRGEGGPQVEPGLARAAAHARPRRSPRSSPPAETRAEPSWSGPTRTTARAESAPICTASRSRPRLPRPRGRSSG